MLEPERIESIKALQLAYLTPASATWAKRRKQMLMESSLESVAPELVKSWSTLNVLLPEQVTAGVKLPALWDCAVCERLFKCSIQNRVKGKGCPACGAVKRASSYGSTKAAGGRSFADRAPAWLLQQWHPELNSLNPEEISYGTAKSVWWRCSCGHQWRSSVKNRLAQFTPCSNCSPKSRFEQMLLALISERYSGPLVQNSKPLRTDAGARMELDFWLPELRLGFEMQDFATHSRDSDEEPSAFAFRGELHKKGPTYHSLKRELTRDQLNGLLVEIWEDQLRSTAAGLKLETALASAKRRVSE